MDEFKMRNIVEAVKEKNPDLPPEMVEGISAGIIMQLLLG